MKNSALTLIKNSGISGASHAGACVEFESSQITGAGRREYCATFFMPVLRREGVNTIPARGINTLDQCKLSTPATRGENERSPIVVSKTINTGDYSMSSLISKYPKVTIVNGTAKTTSLAVADYFGKRHNDVLKKIRSLIEEMGDEFYQRNFAGVEYKDAKGEVRPSYEITRDGFSLLAMGFTGKRALQWKIAYINAFNAMESCLKQTSIAIQVEPSGQHKLPIKHKAPDFKRIHDLCDELFVVLGHFQMMNQQSQCSRAKQKVQRILLDTAHNAATDIVKEVIFHA